MFRKALLSVFRKDSNVLFFFFLFLPAARTAVLSFMKAKETSAREKDLFRSVKVRKSSAKSNSKFYVFK